MRRTLIKGVMLISILLFITLIIGCGKDTLEEEIGMRWPKNADFSYIANEIDLVIHGKGEKMTVANVDFRGGYDWSPTGKEIALSFEGQLFIISEDGGKRYIADGEWPLWSPDGRKITYRERQDNKEVTEGDEETSSGKERLILLDIETNEKYVLDEHFGVRYDWFFDGSKLVYWYYNQDTMDEECYAYDLVSGEKEQLLDNIDSGRLDSIVCSPYAPYFAVGLYHGHDFVKLALFDYDTKQLRDLYNEEGALIGVLWSPDGERIAASKSHSTQEHPYKIIVLNLRGEIVEELNNNDEEFGNISGHNIASAWSPDGSKIAFVRDYSFKTSIPDIYIWHLSEDNATQASETSQFYVERITFSGINHLPRWNPNPDY